MSSVMPRSNHRAHFSMRVSVMDGIVPDRPGRGRGAQYAIERGERSFAVATDRPKRRRAHEGRLSVPEMVLAARRKKAAARPEKAAVRCPTGPISWTQIHAAWPP